MATSTTNPLDFELRCDGCGRAYYDENYRGESCRECGEILG